MKRLNEQFIDLMEKLSSIMLKHGEQFRARAYQKAQESILSYEKDIINPEQINHLPGIGNTIMEKLKEYVQTGTLLVLEREKTNPINILGEIYGVGPKKATDLISMGITTISQLREKQDLVLNDTQKIGLKYYENILERIPRSEIDNYDTIFKKIFKTVSNVGSRFEIVGSYRRGATNSGDIDMIITADSGVVFKNFIDQLIKNKIIQEVLSRGQTKCLVIAKLPDYSVARRVDFLYTSPEEYPFSVLYFTGSKIFNTVMRSHAQTLGYSLNEHGIYKMEGNKKGEKVSLSFIKDESDIFSFLNMVYKEPQERIDGRAVSTISTNKVTDFKPMKISNGTPSASVCNLSVMTLNKKMGQSPILIIQGFKKNGIVVLKKLSESQLENMVNDANKAFHLNKTPIMTDNEYDILKEFFENKFPANKILTEVGTTIIIEKNKVELPYEMASMDKIKPDTSALSTWKQKFNEPSIYAISCINSRIVPRFVVPSLGESL